MTTVYITTTIPYVNALPHLGFALELVQADVLARYHRRAGRQVRFRSGTDDNSLKNVLAAEAAGAAVREFVDANAAAFTGLAIGTHLAPFLPGTAARITRQCTPDEDGLLPAAVPILPRIGPLPAIRQQRDRH